MNELFGAATPTPWTPTTARYRANVLEWARLLAARGAQARAARLERAVHERRGRAVVARPGRRGRHRAREVLQRAGRPQGRARRSAAGACGPRCGRSASEALRDRRAALEGRARARASRRAAARAAGRACKPAGAWFEVAKLQALAAKQVARELGIAHIWSWGWGVFNERAADPDKPGPRACGSGRASPRLCDAPRCVEQFDRDLRAGQIDLPAGVRCALGERDDHDERDRRARPRSRGDPEVGAVRALRAARRAQEAAVGPSDSPRRRAHDRRAQVRRQGGGYLGALQRARATRAVARDILGDELRRRSIQARLTVPRPSGAQLAELQQTYGSVQAREVQVEPAPSWLPDGRGVALALDAPPQVFTAPLDRAITIRTFEGVFVVRALADTAPLAAIPAAAARPAIARALRTAAQADRYHAGRR